VIVLWVKPVFLRITKRMGTVDGFSGVTESAKSMSFGILAPLTLAALALMSSITGGSSEPPVRSVVRIVDVRGAASLVARGATVLDARDAASFAQGHLPGAQPYAWQAMTGQAAARGKIRPNVSAVAQALATLGVDRDRPTLVYGAAGNGWGEEGHAAWLLALLGHPDIALLDGGFAAWRAAGRPVVTTTASPRVGRFDPNVRTEWRAVREDLSKSRQIVDVRSAVEFRGATPYGEPRGGHIPGAKHLDWRTLLDEGGRIRSSARISRALADAGIDPAKEIVTYCTAGVRSAFVTVALTARGVSTVRNYDGSLVEWASDPANEMVR
jgi:thiosulfate/3-mercaptopyruvate sulfurtransferase